MAGAADARLGRLAGVAQVAAGPRCRAGPSAWLAAAPGECAAACFGAVCVENSSLAMLAAFGGECSNGGAAVSVCSVVGGGMRDHERAVVILVRARRVVAQRVRLAVGRVVERGCRGGAHHDDTVTFF